jgi:hypothetical protein
MARWEIGNDERSSMIQTHLIADILGVRGHIGMVPEKRARVRALGSDG